MATAPDIEDQAHPTDEGHGHSSNVAHHFDSAQQQFDAGKLGMWLFLVTEVLFFSGLFVAYAVYRANHPEVFVNAHKYLNTTLGAFNTIVLLVSSLTMAWAVRSAQLNQKTLLVKLLAITLACASLFLGVKAVEYSHKWDKGLLWAGAYAVTSDLDDATEGPAQQADPVQASDNQDNKVHEEPAGHHAVATESKSTSLLAFSSPAILATLICCIGIGFSQLGKRPTARKFWYWMLAVSLAFFAGVVIGQTVELLSHHDTSPASSEHSEIAGGHSATASISMEEEAKESRKYTGVFFSIYYAMTGVHAIHILAGMGVIAWLLWRSIREEFSSQYFGPVDYVGLYWHLVDLVWIYLFPLLYLIR